MIKKGSLKLKVFHFISIVCLFTNVLAAAPITDKNWISAGQARGADREIGSLALDRQGNLLAAGCFVSVGGVAVNFSTAKWDGAAWSSPWSNCASRSGGDSLFYTYTWESPHIAVDESGDCYLAGPGVFRLTGSTWRAMFDTIEGNVTALAAHKGIVYAAGDFWRTSDTRTLPEIMKWDGSAWTPLGRLIRGEKNDQCVNALAVDSSGNLYVGGRFASAGKLLAGNVAKWNGASWSVLDKGVAFTVYAMAFDKEGKLYVGGFDDTPESETYKPLKSVFRWDGASWQSIESGTAGEIRALLCNRQGAVCAAGQFDSIGNAPAGNCAKWDGKTWQALGATLDGRVFSLAEGKNGELYAAGWIASAGGYLAGNIARWDGGEWSPLGTGFGLHGSLDVLAIDTFGTIFEGYHADESLQGPNVACRGKNGWMPLGRGAGSDGVWAIAPDNRGGAFVGGLIAPYGRSEWGPAWWNGSKWSGTGLGVGQLIMAMAMDKNGDLFAGGEFQWPLDTAWGHIARRSRDGAWSALGKGCNGSITALAADTKGALFAGGEFDSAGGSPVSHIAKWNGTAWSSLGKGLRSGNGSVAVSAIVCDKAGNIYVAGDFDSAGEQRAACVAKWDGERWSALGRGIRGGDGWIHAPGRFVHSLVFDAEGNLYAGGVFDSAGGCAARNVARWDGDEWSPLGGGCNGDIRGMVVDRSGVLHVGGVFDTAGGVFSPSYAMCRVSGPEIKSTRTTVSPAAIKVENGRIRIRLATAGEVSVRVMTLSGREVFRSCSIVPAGDHAVGIATRSLARGAYVAHVKYGNEAKKLRMFVDR